MTTPVAGDVRVKIAQIFLESAEFRHRGDPLEAPPNQPIAPSPVQLHLDLRVGDDTTGAAVRLRAQSDDPEARYFFSVSYIVLMEIEGGFQEASKNHIMALGGTVAMPFVRELVGNLSGRGRHGATWVSPVNFGEIVKQAQGAP